MEVEKTNFYANSVSVAITPYDFQLLFVRNGLAETTDIKGTEAKHAPLAQLTLLMSPQHVKAMLPALLATVAQYESTIGKIPLQQELQAQFDAAFIATGGQK